MSTDRSVFVLCLFAGCAAKQAVFFDAMPLDAATASDSTVDDARLAVDAPATTPDASANAATVIRLHYPLTTSASGHSITVRGSGGGLSWIVGENATGSGDDISVALTGVTGVVEWKPLLDDATWAIGPNYRVAPGQTIDVWPHFTTQTGQVVTLIADFHSTVLDDDRPIYAYLPASYQENTDATFPVVYMHDGQNLWAALPQLAFSGTWNVDTAFDDASQTGTCSSDGVVGWGAQPLGGVAVACNGDGDCSSGQCRTFPEAIVIGIANDAQRIFEYTPTTDPTTSGGGGADQYLTMVTSELKPTIDSMLRTRTDASSTAMAGSSLGGLVTAYAAITYPDVYGMVAELSPSSWWNDDVIVNDVATETQAAPDRASLVYIDSGAGDVDAEADTDSLAAAYVAEGYVDGTTIRHVVQQGAAHDETYWAQRFPGAMQFILGTR